MDHDREGAGVERIRIESDARGGSIQVALPAEGKRVARANLLKRQAEPLKIIDGAVQLALRPWEIATLRWELTET